MKRRAIASLASLCLSSVVITSAAASRAKPLVTPPEPNRCLAEAPSPDITGVPLHFEPNVGQFAASILFEGRVKGYRMRFTASAAHYMLDAGGVQSEVVQRHLEANAAPQVAGGAPLPGKIHRLQGKRTAHRRNIPTYARVRYSELYPGVDLVHYGNQRRLESDYEVAPGADPTVIRFVFDGAERVEIDSAGELLVHTAAGILRHRAPYAYQVLDGAQVEVASRFVETDGVVSFELGQYDKSKALTIDPVLVYSTYFGGTSLERVSAGGDSGGQVATDAAGNTYVVASTLSNDLPTQSAVQTAAGGSNDVFVAKFSPTGTLLFSTYLGGSQNDDPAAIRVHSDGTIYVAGTTNSPDFPTSRCDTGAFTFCGRTCDAGEVGAFQNFCGNASEVPANYCMDVTGCSASDGFLSRLSATGDKLLYSTFLGGSDADLVNDMYVDSAGLAYLVGDTASSSTEPPNAGAGDNEAFPVSANAYDKLINDDDIANNLLDGDGFLAVIDPNQNYGLGKIYISYLGGSGDDEAWRLDVDPNGFVYVVGKTASADFPALNGWSTSRLGTGSDRDIFLLKLDRNATGANQNLYGTFFGGDNREDPHAISVPAEDEVYIAGGAVGDSTFPRTTGAFQENWPGTFADAGFVSRFDTSVGGTAALQWSTFLAGGPGDTITDMQIAPNGNLYIVGTSVNGSLLPAIRPFTFESVENSFLGSLTPNGATMDFLGTFFASAALPNLTVNPTSGMITVVAESGARILDSASKSTSEGGDLALLQFLPTDTDISITVSGSPNPVVLGNEVTFTVRATNVGPTRVAQFDIRGFSDPASGMSATPVVATLTQGTGSCDASNFTRICVVYDLDVGETFEFTVKTTPSGGEGILGYDARIGSFGPSTGIFHTDTDSSNDTALGGVNAFFTLPAGADLAVSQTDSPDPIELGSGNVTYTVTATNQGPDAATGVTVTDTVPAGATLVSATPSTGSCSGTATVTCDLGALAAQASATIAVEVTPTMSGSLSNSASISGTETDPVASNDTSTEQTTVTEPPGGTPMMTAGPCANSISAQTVSPGAASVPVLQFQLGAPSDEDVTVFGLDLDASGSGDDSTEVASFSVYRDVNADGVVDSGDVMLATGSFGVDDGSASPVINPGVALASGSNACILVTYDFSGTGNGSLLPPVGPKRIPWLPVGGGLALGAAWLLFSSRRRFSSSALRTAWAPLTAGAFLLLAPACDGGDDDGKPTQAQAGSNGMGIGGAGVGGSGADGGTAGSAVGGDAGSAGSAGSSGSGGSGAVAGSGGSSGGPATFSLSVTSVSATSDVSSNSAVVSGLPIDGVTLTLQ